MTNLENFLAVMEYRTPDKVPNWEVGVWSQTVDRWEKEGLDRRLLTWDWFTGEDYFGFDNREYIPINLGMMPRFSREIIERTDRYEVVRHGSGIVTKALIEGTSNGGRMSMDQYLSFPVETAADFEDIKKRYIAGQAARYETGWKEFRLEGWKNRKHPLIAGRNCSTLGFYWRAREWLGTENLSYAWYDDPDLCDNMMEFTADFTIEMLRPVLDEIAPDYIFINEDMSMKSGPLLSPEHYKRFIFPRMRRLVDFVKGKGTKYVIVDTDGDPEPLIPLLMDAGVDGLWPIERAAQEMDPLALRKKYGKDLRIWGAVDKRCIAAGPDAIDEHLRTMIPLIEEGGFIPTVDHTVPPDVSLENFRYYMKQKQKLLRGEIF
jgi:uroporphyrinogen decarboxylase